jgi:hypothetical protein
VSPSLALTFYGYFSDENVDSLAADAQVLGFGGVGRYALGKSLSLLMRIESQKRTSNDARNEFSELSGAVLLRYGRNSSAQ